MIETAPYPNTSSTGNDQTEITQDSSPLQVGIEELRQHMDNVADKVFQMPEPKSSTAEQLESHLLERLLDRQNQLKQSAEKAVVFSPALISRYEVGIIRRNTINLIQGAFGSHKSRLAELFGSLILSTNPGNGSQYLGFTRVMLEQFWLCYIDTERNHMEELPYALQQIKLKAGYNLEETPANFRFTSIKDIDRKKRLKAVEVFLRHVRAETSAHLFVILDVVTDCVSSFNDDEQAMQLFDFIGNLCDRHNATFLLVIHQNPGSEKARGHTGSEGGNKAATVMQIGYEQATNGHDTDLIRLRYIKLRQGKRPEPVYLQYSEEAKGLVLADSGAVTQYINNRKQKAATDDIVERLESLLSEGPLPKNEVWSILEVEFKTKNTTIRNRLREIADQQPPMYDAQGCLIRLDSYKEGRNEFYRLMPIDNSN